MAVLLKDVFKSAIYMAGLGHQYHNLWWKRPSRTGPAISAWNRHHRAIFIHIPKNAGTSIYGALGMERPKHTHMPIAAYRAADETFFQDAFKFAIVRNPWDRLVSAYLYLKAGRTKDDRAWFVDHLARYASIREFVLALQNPFVRGYVLAWRHFMPQWYFICERQGEVAVNELLRFERLKDDLPALMARLGIDRPIDRANATEREPYQRYFDSETREIVGSIYKDDISMFGYRFDEDDETRLSLLPGSAGNKFAGPPPP